MNKFIFVFLAVLAITASAKFSFRDLFQKNRTPDFKAQIDFFLGASSVFGLEDAAKSLLVCTGDSAVFLLNIKAAFTDLTHKKVNSAIQHFVEALNNIHAIQEDCPEGALPFIKTFGPAVIAWRANPTVFYTAVAKSFAANPVATFKATYKLYQDYKHKEFRAVGEDFGTLLEIGLRNYLTTMSNDAVFMLQVKDEINPNQALEFFYGFSSAFGLDDAALNLVACGTTDSKAFIESVRSLIKDIKKSDWNQLLNDAVALYGNVKALQTDCRSGAVPFINEFGPVINAFHKDKAAFLAKVGKNVQSNMGSLLLSFGKIIQDFNRKDFKDAGVQFGNDLHIAIKGVA